MKANANATPMFGDRARAMSAQELVMAGAGEVAYIKQVTPEWAAAAFPAVEGLPQTGTLFLVGGADGGSIALTDTYSAAVGHVIAGDMSLVAVH